MLSEHTSDRSDRHLGRVSEWVVGERETRLRGRDSLAFNGSLALVQTLAWASVINQTGLDSQEYARRRGNACGNRSVNQILLETSSSSSADLQALQERYTVRSVTARDRKRLKQIGDSITSFEN